MSEWKNVQYKDGKMRTGEGGGGGGSSTFAGLDDVSFSDLQNGQIPKYNSTMQKWENANESGGSSSADDVTYDNTTSGMTATNVQDALDEIAQDFQDGCNIISQAVIAKGQTPASNSPQDIATAISNIDSSTPQRIYVVDPSIMSCLASGSSTTKYWGIKHYSQSGYTAQVGISAEYITIGYGGSASNLANHTDCFPIKIPKEYKIIYMDIQASGKTGSYNLVTLNLSTTGDLTSQTGIANVFKSVSLTAYNKTPAQINSQAGVTINSTSQYSLDRQIVKVDLTGVVTEDYFVCFHGCDSWYRIWSMYAEMG